MDVFIFSDLHGHFDAYRDVMEYIGKKMKTDSRYHFILGKNEALLLGAMGKENIGKQFIDVLNTHHKKIINQ